MSILLKTNFYYFNWKLLFETNSPFLSKTFNNIRQIIANSEVDDFSDLFRFLFDKLSEYASGSEGEVIMAIEEYQYHSNFRIDSEINIMALISKIIKTIWTHQKNKLPWCS